MASDESPVSRATPVLSPRTAAILSVGSQFRPAMRSIVRAIPWHRCMAAYVLLYVIPFYLSPTTRPSKTLSRDAPSSIRARTRTVNLSTVVCSLTTVLVLSRNHVSASQILTLLGLWPISPLDTARTMLLVTILFAGPIFEYGLVDGDWKDWIRLRGLRETLSSWIGYRNFIVGPVSEEIVWRSCMVPLHLLARFSGKQIVFLTPLYFGIAHLHHLYEFRITHPKVPLVMAVLRSLFQFTYTSLFGFFAAFVFLRTGNIVTCVLAHTFCNWMGLPRFYGRVGVEAGMASGPADVHRQESQLSKGISRTIAYYIILVLGAYGFYAQLFSLTESSHALPVVLVDS